MDVESKPPSIDDAGTMPSYGQFVYRVVVSCREFCFNWQKYPFKWSFVQRSLDHAIKNCNYILLIVLVSIIMTLIRHISTIYLIRPICHRLRLKPKEAKKFPEAFFRWLLYSILWTLSIYYIFYSGQVDYYDKPCNMFKNMSFGEHYFQQTTPKFAKLIYVLQSAFYLHSTYATLYMDYIRTDFVTMMMHHMVTCTLLILSYFIQFHKIGILVLYVHDATDILMEFAKMNVYLKHRNNQVYMIHEYIANTSFAVFTIAWVYFRLYLFPLKVLHAGTWCIYLFHRGTSQGWLFNLFNGMLFFLQAIHIYWFYFILRIIARIATGKMKELDDIREDEEDAHSNIKTNGHKTSTKKKVH